ncbi:hypothetical protein FIV42_00770 [Persicimonas caeni]|uniref:YHYH domain-containing protein n=1 Tax=Persicimonas caeni TaxID=2292766 RepID=A0A4Y6PMQ8_PERCE|nr:hypothetical protein [Persicimonas caeni]QDG49317.1 hypothetical protein FIV42_00770 [Persicimonas caeni]QED30538.1 hypothetical protein FRD00_00765 [Persicimonas caeni]
MQKLWLTGLSALVLSAPLAASAHEGLKDKKGCHTKNDGSDYHCHKSESTKKTPASTDSQTAATSTGTSGSTADSTKTADAGSKCDLDSFDGQLVKFDKAEDLKKYGFQLWSERPKLVGDGVAYDKLQGRKGKLLSKPISHSSSGLEEQYYQVVLDDCSKVYTSTLGSPKSGTALQDFMASNDVFYVLEDGLDADVTFPHSQLRSREGACVRRSLKAPSSGSYRVTIEVCMRVGAPKTLDDDKIPRVRVLVRGREHLVYGKAWQLIASRDGKRLFKGRLGDNTPTLLDCSQYGCTHMTLSTPISGKELTEGEYTFHFTYAQNTDRQHKMRIKLTPDEKGEKTAESEK